LAHDEQVVAVVSAANLFHFSVDQMTAAREPDSVSGCEVCHGMGLLGVCEHRDDRGPSPAEEGARSCAPLFRSSDGARPVPATSTGHYFLEFSYLGSANK
jgi:hypothetical protein